jgi:hypothetical protein
MPATIKIKNSSTALAVPTSSDLVQGELAVNVTDKRIFTENASGTVVELGTNPSILTLPDGSASAPTLTNDGDTNTGIFFPAADTVGITTGGTERARVDSSGNLGLGTTSPSAKLHIASDGPLIYLEDTAGGNNEDYSMAVNFGAFTLRNVSTSKDVLSLTDTECVFYTDGSERMRLDASGNLLVGKTSTSFSTAGCRLDNLGRGQFVASGSETISVNRLTNDGVLIEFYQDTTLEGNISVSGTTVSYNGGHLARYAQTIGAKDESLKKGTVLSNLDEMNTYTAPTTYWTEEDELPEGVSVGDVKVEEHQVANEQLNKVKVSDVEGDANVAGVFVNWSHDEDHNVDEINMAMTGDMIIRIAQGTTVSRGDLLMSAGDGTAKPQGDDIVRAKTIAKVTSTHVTCTYEDGSYCVPCVLMAC